jgi:hydroxyacylglutathione hydrolase
MALQIHQFPALRDNYAWLVHADGPDGGVTAVIDTPEVAAIEKALADTGWRLTHILNTHHHHDHAGGNLVLKEKYGCTIIGPRAEAARIPGLDIAVGEGETVALGDHVARVIDVPGHTSGHIAYWFANDGVAFVGDTLFAMGCGRLFEGTPQQMWHSLSKLMALPDDTVIYCAHEYTEANGRFALTVEPGNAALRARMDEVKRLREKGQPTVPTTLGLEKETNPFLRPASANLQKTLGLEGAPLVEVFAETRRRKDSF